MDWGGSRVLLMEDALTGQLKLLLVQFRGDPRLSMQKGAWQDILKLNWAQALASQSSVHRGHPSITAIAEMGMGSPGALHSEGTWEDS